MKRIILLAFILSCGIALFAQTSVVEGKTTYQNSSQPAVIAELPYAPDVVEGAIKEYMSLKGYKSAESRGFLVFRAYKLNELEPLGRDVYFKVERKSKREKDMSVVYIMGGKNGEDIKTRVSPDNTTLEGITALISDMNPSMESFNLNVQIKAQEELVKKAEKKFDGLADDQKDMEKKKKRLEDDMSDNLKKQDEQKAEIEKQRQVLETLKGKRKS